CDYRTAKANIVAIPDVTMQAASLTKLLEVAQAAIDAGQVACGSYDEAVFHLNSLHRHKFLDCPKIFERYGEMAKAASRRIAAERGVTVHPEWILAIVKKETDGVVRPRFEQHYLSRLENANPNADLRELRFRSMSFGLGQIMGENFQMVGAPSAFAMFTAPLPEQVYYVGRFLAASGKTRPAVAKTNPMEEDFRAVARTYNGPNYEVNRYHESLETWFKTFRELMG
ncbi:MAG: N-acetylmuramidase domain-containing protein, partial [Bacteroidota bacterium]